MVKSVLIVSGDSCKIPSYGYRIKKAFLNLGWEVNIFNYRQLQMHRLKFTRNLVNVALLNKARDIKPDVLLVLKGESIEESIIKGISDEGITTVCWTLDDPFGEFSKFDEIKNRNEYDYFFVFDPYYVPKLKKTGQPNAYYLPCAVDPEIHKEQIPMRNRIYKYPLSFVGSHSLEREILFCALIDYNSKIWGYRWKNKVKGLLKNKISDKIYHAHKSVKDTNTTCRIFNQTKINMNHHLNHSRQGLNLRTFEIPATYSFQLVDYFSELPNLFEVGKEIVCYHNIEEARQLIDYYLEHPRERERIAYAGYQRVLKDHTFEHRIKKILEVIKS